MFECNPSLVWQIFTEWPIFWNVFHISQCDPSFPNVTHFSATHFSKFDPYLTARPTFLQCNLFFTGWPIFLVGAIFQSLTHFIQGDSCLQMWPIFYVVTNLSQINFFLKCEAFFFTVWLICITYFIMRPNFVNVTRFSKLTQFSKCDPFFTVWHN